MLTWAYCWFMVQVCKYTTEIAKCNTTKPMEVEFADAFLVLTVIGDVAIVAIICGTVYGLFFDKDKEDVWL